MIFCFALLPFCPTQTRSSYFAPVLLLICSCFALLSHGGCCVLCVVYSANVLSFLYYFSASFFLLFFLFWSLKSYLSSCSLASAFGYFPPSYFLWPQNAHIHSRARAFNIYRLSAAFRTAYTPYSVHSPHKCNFFLQFYRTTGSSSVHPRVHCNAVICLHLCVHIHNTYVYAVLRAPSRSRSVLFSFLTHSPTH